MRGGSSPTGRTNGCLTTTRCTGPFWPRCERSARPSLAPDKRARSAASASNSASERLVREPDREAGRPGSPSVLRSLPRGHWPNLMKTSKRSVRSEEHTSELQSRQYLVCRLLLEKKNTKKEEHSVKRYMQ